MGHACRLGKPIDRDAEKAKEELEANKQSKVVTGLFGLVRTLAKECVSAAQASRGGVFTGPVFIPRMCTVPGHVKLS